MVLSVLDGSTIRTPHNIYVLDGSTIRRVRQIRALDGSTIRHPFTKTDYFDFSGTANTLTPAVAEVYNFTEHPTIPIKFNEKVKWLKATKSSLSLIHI